MGLGIGQGIEQMMGRGIGQVTGQWAEQNFKRLGAWG
jgi:hypothetical protein